MHLLGQAVDDRLEIQEVIRNIYHNGAVGFQVPAVSFECLLGEQMQWGAE